MLLKLSSAKCRPICLGLNMLKTFNEIQYIPRITQTFRILLWFSNRRFSHMIPQNYFTGTRAISLLQTNTLQWRHDRRDGVSNHQPQDCLLNRLFWRRSKKTSKHRVTDPCAGNSPGPVNSPHKWPVTRKNVSIWWRHHDIAMVTNCVLWGSNETEMIMMQSCFPDAWWSWGPDGYSRRNKWPQEAWMYGAFTPIGRIQGK